MATSPRPARLVLPASILTTLIVLGASRTAQASIPAPDPSVGPRPPSAVPLTSSSPFPVALPSLLLGAAVALLAVALVVVLVELTVRRRLLRSRRARLRSVGG
jgi:hypothetical protein